MHKVLEDDLTEFFFLLFLKAQGLKILIEKLEYKWMRRATARTSKLKMYVREGFYSSGCKFAPGPKMWGERDGLFKQTSFNSRVMLWKLGIWHAASTKDSQSVCKNLPGAHSCFAVWETKSKAKHDNHSKWFSELRVHVLIFAIEEKEFHVSHCIVFLQTSRRIIWISLQLSG